MIKPLVIERSKTLSSVRLAELWEYRELFYFLIWGDVKVRYKQTLLGAGWAIIRPVASMVVFTFIFNKLAGFSAEGIPYALLGVAHIQANLFTLILILNLLIFVPVFLIFDG